MKRLGYYLWHTYSSVGQRCTLKPIIAVQLKKAIPGMTTGPGSTEGEFVVWVQPN